MFVEADHVEEFAGLQLVGVGTALLQEFLQHEVLQEGVAGAVWEVHAGEQLGAEVMFGAISEVLLL